MEMPAEIRSQFEDAIRETLGDVTSDWPNEAPERVLACAFGVSMMMLEATLPESVNDAVQSTIDRILVEMFGEPTDAEEEEVASA